jgi:methylglutaconyl-CoA hydratase
MSITTTQTGSVLTITLARPEVHNAFDERMIADLTHAFEEATDNDAVRAIVLRAEGASFCAGADLNWMRRMAGYSEEQNREDSRTLERMFSTIARCPKAIIGRIHGAALGGGAGLVAVCDIAIASTEAKFALSEVRLGLVPAVIGPYVLQKIGMGACRALFVTGERIRAEEALRIGLVQQVVPPDQLDAAVEAKLGLIREAGPAAIATAKQLLRVIDGMNPAEAAGFTTECIAALRVSPEGQEGIRAFLEKRKPKFAEETE